MKRFVVLGLFAGLVLSGLLAISSPDPVLAQEDRKDVMRSKLREAEDILRALTVENYDVIAESARELNQLSIEAEWTEALSPLYGKMGDEFRTAADRLMRAAEDENLDGATLYYNQLVASCVECHKIVRGENNLAKVDAADRPWLRQ